MNKYSISLYKVCNYQYAQLHTYANTTLVLVLLCMHFNSLIQSCCLAKILYKKVLI